MIIRRTPGELRKLDFWETGEPRVLQSGPEWRYFRPAWGLGAGGETGPEAVNLAACGGESGRDTTTGEVDLGRRGWGCLISENQFSGKWTFGTRPLDR